MSLRRRLQSSIGMPSGMQVAIASVIALSFGLLASFLLAGASDTGRVSVFGLIITAAVVLCVFLGVAKALTSRSK
jgi:predicted anti-sigma-YlaC factor YlaD